jgi:hypothetical protein
MRILELLRLFKQEGYGYNEVWCTALLESNVTLDMNYMRFVEEICTSLTS